MLLQRGAQVLHIYPKHDTVSGSMVDDCYWLHSDKFINGEIPQFFKKNKLKDPLQIFVMLLRLYVKYVNIS